MKQVIQIPQTAWKILDALSQNGGTPVIVGGWVRDQLLGTPSKDIDIEVFGISADVVELALRSIPDASVKLVGESFGVYKVTCVAMKHQTPFPHR